MREQHGSGRARNAWNAVMLRHPEALVLQSLSVPGKIERMAKSLRCVAAFDDWSEIENRKRNQYRVNRPSGVFRRP